MSRTFLLFVCAVSLVFCITSYSCADLIDNGDGTVTQIRSDGTKLMWTKDTLLAGDSALPESNKNWNEAKLWAANLNFAGYSDWRLPRTPGTVTNGITTEGELGDLYHSELGDLRNPDKFKMSDTHNNVFWTETELGATSVFIVNFGNFKGKYEYSYQQTCSAKDNRQAWAVRDVTDSISGAEAAEVTTDTEVAEVATDAEVTAVADVVTDTEDATVEEVSVEAEIAADTEATVQAEVTTETESSETTEATANVEVIEDSEITTNTEATTDTEVVADTETTQATEATLVTETTTKIEAAGNAEITASTETTSVAEVAVDTAVTTVAEVATETEITGDTEVAETPESQVVQEYTRAKGETEGDRIALHIRDENNIKSVYNGDCIKVFWEEQPGNNAEITLCLYGINDYRWEEKSFWISFNKGSSIKCDEVSIYIPLGVMTHDQINTIFKIETTDN